MSNLVRLSLGPEGLKRLAARHPWVYRGHLAKGTGEARPGDWVALCDRGRPLAWGWFGPGAIAVRVLAFQEVPDPLELVRRRLDEALAWRRRWCPDEEAFRWVHGEGDGLPGLIVDVYGRHASVQMLVSGWAIRAKVLVECLLERLPLEGVVLRNDGKHLEKEGLVREVRLLAGTLPADGTAEARIGSLRQRVDLMGGQKTGAYLDVRHWVRPLLERFEGARVLDAFSYQGHFGLHALAAGAERVVALEQSEEAIALAGRNRGLNALPDRMEWARGNAFDALRELERRGERFDAAILDPPPFSPSRGQLEGARRGYKELALRAFRLLESGGTLLFGSCSHAFSRELLLSTLEDAARDARTTFRVAGTLGQPADHPAVGQVPESDYLKGFLLGVDHERKN